MTPPPPLDTGDATPGYIARGSARWARIPGNVRGGLWTLMAAGFYAVMMALVKYAGQTLHVTEILLFRQAFMMLFTLPVMLRHFPASLQTARPGLQVVRLVVALFAMLFGFTAVIHLPLANAVTIGFARTFFISLFAILLLAEIVGTRRWAAMVVGFGGVLLAAQPEGFGSFNIYGLFAIGHAACAGLVMVIIRILSRTDRPVTILAYQAFAIGIMMIPPAIWFWQTPTPLEWLLLVAIGGISVLSQTCNIYAFRAAEASAIAPLDYVRLVWATLLGIVVFSEWPSARVLTGAAIIVGAGLYTLHREHRTAQLHAKRDRSANEDIDGTI